MSVIPINRDIKGFRDSLKLLKKHQSLPVLLYAIKNCLQSNSNLKEVTNQLKGIFSCSDDQFWGKYGSKYFSENYTGHFCILSR